MPAQDDDLPSSALSVQEARTPYEVTPLPAGALAPASPTVPKPIPAPKPARRVAGRDGKVLGQPGFVLHSYPYKETSLIVDMFTRDFGRIGVVAKGAKRPLSKLRGVLQTFQPLSISFSGKSELRTLIDAEWVGGMLPLEKTALLCGFYLNELLVKLLARDDPHPKLFDHYVATLNELAFAARGDHWLVSTSTRPKACAGCWPAPSRAS